MSQADYMFTIDNTIVILCNNREEKKSIISKIKNNYCSDSYNNVTRCARAYVLVMQGHGWIELT